MESVARNGGFFSDMSKGQILAIPPAFMFCSFVRGTSGDVDNSIGLRWGCIDMDNKKTMKKVLDVVDEMLEITEGLDEDESWTSWRFFLRKSCEEHDS